MIETFDCPQGSEEWFKVRRGIVTASEFATILAKGVGKAESKTRSTYMRKLADEVMYPDEPPVESYSNVHIERGKTMEDEARRLYAFVKEAELTSVGFIKNAHPIIGTIGCSPDSLIGGAGGLEIKTALPHILVDKKLRGGFPPEHKPQVQGNMLTTGREWWDLMIYWPGRRPFITRALRDEAYIHDLSRAIADFNEELEEMVERIRRFDGGRTFTADLRASLEVVT